MNGAYFNGKEVIFIQIVLTLCFVVNIADLLTIKVQDRE